MSLRLKVPIIFPSRSPSTPPAPSLRRVPRSRFPCLLSTTRWLRLLVFLRRRSVTVAAPYLDRVSYLSLPFGHGRHDPRARGHFFNAVPSGVFHVIEEITRAPRFLDNPCLHAPLYDPGGSIGCSDAEGCRENRVAVAAGAKSDHTLVFQGIPRQGEVGHERDVDCTPRPHSKLLRNRRPRPPSGRPNPPPRPRPPVDQPSPAKPIPPGNGGDRPSPTLS